MLKTFPAYAVKNYMKRFKLSYPMLYCNFQGIKVDALMRNKIKDSQQRILDSSLGELRVMLDDPNFNPSSPKQVKACLYDLLGAKDMRVGAKKKAGVKVRNARGTDDKNLEAIALQHPILLRVTTAIAQYRIARKAISTYMNFLQKNGRLLYSINPFGTETGRMSCKSSTFWCGTQIQNIPSYAKEMLVADEGFLLGEPDNSQSEARCTAYLAQETNLIAALEGDKDFYRTLGTLFFGLPYERVSDELRNEVLKKIVHGTNYMMGATTFIENTGAEKLLAAAPSLGLKVVTSEKIPKGCLSLKQYATVLLDSYHKPFPRVRMWYREVKSEIVNTKLLVSPLGYTRYFFGDMEKSYSAFNSAVAHAPQNLSVSVLDIGLWKVWKLVLKYEGDLILLGQIHDSLPFQYREGREDVRKEVVAALDNPIVVHGRTLRIPVDCKVGKSWGTMTKLKREKV
jgi:DNA polymerase I-like protein with 3'-5' exonuclease and polymerase domains